MRITAANLLSHEFIGLYVRVAASTQGSLRGLAGIVVDETRNTLSIRTERGVKMLPKSTVELELLLPSGEKVTVDGRRMVSRPEDRIAKRTVG